MATSVCSRVTDPHRFSFWYRMVTTHGALWNEPSSKPSSWSTWTATCMPTCSEVSSLLNCWKWHSEVSHYGLLTEVVRSSCLDIDWVLCLGVYGPRKSVGPKTCKKNRALCILIIWLASWAGKRCDWLPEQAKWRFLARSRLLAVSHKQIVFFFPYNKSFNLLFGHDGWILASFCFVFGVFMNGRLRLGA